jgi:uncharacterized protein with NAD-binding domain and iron-sulfur cluster
MNPPPKKIAILGGGPAAIATAFWLTDRPSWRDEYEITVYQMGWRVGGKCASGRNMKDGYGKRIEEHGLHMFFGCYENAFYTLRRAYETLAAMPSPPVRTFRDWTEAFHPHGSAVLADRVNGRWFEWELRLPRRPGEPGSGGFAPLPWDLVIELFALLREAYQDLVSGAAPASAAGAAPAGWSACARAAAEKTLAFLGLGWLWHALGWTPPGAAAAPADPHAASHAFLRTLVAKHLAPELATVATLARTFEEALLHRLEGVARALPGDVARHDGRIHDVLVDGLAELMRLVRAGLDLLPETEDTVRAAFAIDLAGTTLLGMLRDRVLTRGFEAIDDRDFRDWLRANGARRQTLDSRALLAWYDMAFAFDHGETARPSAAAGTAMLGMLRLIVGYKGAFGYKMQSGMGDTVFTPLYGVLRERGVRFEFFHRVDRLALDRDDPGLVDEIHVSRQATLRPEWRAAGYWPLVRVKDFDCWPNEPDLAQLEDGERFRSLPGYPSLFESNWYEWPASSHEVLRRGEHFDHVVLGIPLPALPRICQDLIDTDVRWRRMLHGDGVRPGVGSVRTLGVQLWFKHAFRNPEHGGMRSIKRPVASGYAEPFDTWSVMDQLLPAEDWPPEASAAAIAYSCGPLPDESNGTPYGDPRYPGHEDDHLGHEARRWFERYWRGLDHGFGPQRPIEELLVDPGGHTGRDALDRQYFRANVDPSERYVVITPGSTQFRLRADESGCRNLTLTGDWIRNPVLSAGFAEAAFAAGMAASRAISGHPARIFGEGWPGRTKE